MILPIYEPKPKAQFEIGQLVKHRRYGYRGVVVAFDTECQASQQWYQNNQTQPDRQQPWYHVLVHQSAHHTYAAQSNLCDDDSGAEIDHPLLEDYFHGFKNNKYLRNTKAWPLA